MNHREDTITAISSPPGVGGVALIRVSGERAFQVTDAIFSADVVAQKPMTVLFGNVLDGSRPIDEVLVTKFKGPRSFTGEDVMEISCHGSLFIQQEILRLLLEEGCRMAMHGEFTKRAFLNGKMDLSQAEAVADLIASESAAEHRLAISQMKGGFSKDISALRQRLIDFASLIELELDFSEEDVEFADRSEFTRLIRTIHKKVSALVDSFGLGNVIKTGIPVAIVGAPNSGKSTLLNALLNEDRAIVSEIAGTTRDSIEDKVSIDGLLFRFIDTAGLRDTEDLIENMGIDRALEKAGMATVVIFLYDANTPNDSDEEIIRAKLNLDEDDQKRILLLVANKCDLTDTTNLPPSHIRISAKEGTGLDELRSILVNSIQTTSDTAADHIVTNARHHDLLNKVKRSLEQVQTGIDQGLSTDLLSIEIRSALHYLGELTGEVSTEDLLGNIFSRFCIGK